jgi:hypothetical protein
VIRRLAIAVLVAAACGLGLSSTARADGTSGVVTAASFQPASPATAGSGANTTLKLSFDYPDSTDTAKALTITFPPGYLAAPAAVTTTCSTAQLAAANCPAASEIGSGQAVVDTVIGPQTAMADAYLMAPPTSSAIVGIGVILNATVLNIPITVTTSGSAGFINSPSGAPELQISLPSLPSSVPVPVIGSVAIQLTQLTLVLSGQAASGKQFVYLPTSCTTATAAFAITTDEGNSGSASASFNATGCPLSFSGGDLATAAQVVDGSYDAAFQTGLTFPAGGAHTSTVTLDIPSLALRANPIYATLNCAPVIPFTGCTVIGSVTATTPLLSAPLVGSAYLTGSVAGFGIGLFFPPPYNIALSGTINSSDGVTVVNFPSIPDLPLTALQLSLTGNDTSAFMASCAGTQTLNGTLTGAGGAASVQLTSTLATQGCPKPASHGPGSQVASYPQRTGGSQTSPRVSSGKISRVASGEPTLSFTVRAGSAKLRALLIRLPSGLSFVGRNLPVTLSSSVAATHRLAQGRLTVSLKRATGAVTVRIGTGGLRPSLALERDIRQHRTKRLTFTVTVGSVGSAKTIHFALSALH